MASNSTNPDMNGSSSVDTQPQTTPQQHQDIHPPAQPVGFYYPSIIPKAHNGKVVQKHTKIKY